jgi:molybdopterin-guanine dinucleotide biosynthesis protein A
MPYPAGPSLPATSERRGAGRHGWQKYNPAMLSVAIQAGGGSTRMGEDKALKPFLKRPLIERVVERLRPIADELLVTTNHPEAYGFLGLPMFSDLKPGRGALGGLYTALASATHAAVAVVACDLPFVSAPLLVASAGILLQDGADVVVAETAHGLEPLHAVYRREACVGPIESAIRGGQWRMISWFSDVQVRKLDPDELAWYDPDGLAFRNVNTPEEFVEAEQLAIERSAPDTSRG